MKLHFSATSPFVRKVVICAHEKGLADRIEYVDESSVGDANPLSKVPTLITDSGESVFDSLVICDYLETLTDCCPMIPRDPLKRNAVLRRHAVADGIMEAGVASVMESRRPEEKQWVGFLASQRAKIDRALALLEHQAGEFADTVDLGTVSVAAALGYLDLRFAAMEWRTTHPRLAAWYAKFSQRASMKVTEPPRQ